MNLSHNKNLYDELFIQIARMHDEVDYRKHLNAYSGHTGKWKDYPSVSVGAEYDNVCAIGHHHTYSSQHDFHPVVFNELLNRLGTLNDNSKNYPACQNRVGHCAENYAASNVLKKVNQNVDAGILSNLLFTKAFRPRNWKNIDWCANCHTVFD